MSSPAGSSSAFASPAPWPLIPKCFCSTSLAPALDPISTAKVEELLFHLKENCTLVIVTHNMQQAARVSDSTAFMLMGDLIEFSPTPQMFTTPTDSRTEAYITGRFG